MLLHRAIKAGAIPDVPGVPFPPVFEISNVIDFVYSTSRESWSYQDIPRHAPPYPEFWMEGEQPEFFQHCQPGTSKLSHPLKAWGAIVMEMPKADIQSVAENMTSNPGLALQDVRWGLHMAVVGEFGPTSLGYCPLESRRIVPMAQVVFLVKTNGEYASHYASIMPDMDELLSSQAQKDELLYSQLNFAVIPISMAIGFLNCPSVRVITNKLSRPQRRLAEREGDKPLLEFHTLDIEPFRKVLRFEGHSGLQGNKKALHACRGYFRVYTEERPLFGVPGLIGTYWTPPTIKGTAERGEIDKSYRIILPGEKR